MPGFQKWVADLGGMNESALFGQMPGEMVFDRPGPGFPSGPMKSAILCTARSGSSLLSVALQAYGFEFHEYLNSSGLLKQIVVSNDVKVTSELAPHFARKATVNGRISIKTPSNGLQYLFAMGEFPKNLDQWRFVYLRRENLVRQAISGFIAQRTGQWTKKMEKRGEVTDSDYSFDEIMKLVGVYAQGNRTLERFIGLLGIPTYNVVYEEFLTDQKRILAEIATFLGADVGDYPDAVDHEPWLERQSTQLNEAWESRFRAELLDQLRAATVPEPA